MWIQWVWLGGIGKYRPRPSKLGSNTNLRHLAVSRYWAPIYLDIGLYLPIPPLQTHGISLLWTSWTRQSTLKSPIHYVHCKLNNVGYNEQIAIYAKTDKADHLSKLNVTKNIKVDKSQCSLEVTNNDVRQDRQKYNPSWQITVYARAEKIESL